MNIYLRKILKHDITHQISITKEVLNGFFNVYKDRELAIMKGKKSGFEGEVTFLLATDPRFGGDIKQIINAEGGMQENDILLFVKSKIGYTIEVISTNDLRHKTFITMIEMERHLIINIDDVAGDENSDDSIVEESLYNQDIDFDRNRIIFGAPGTGKSYKLQEDANGLLMDVEQNMERVTFHPDYTYSQFVGTYKPVMEGKDIKYEFVPGPFMRVYAECLKSIKNGEKKPYLLIIEEINRARVAAVFGDIFQLLDRGENNVSEYEIETTQDIRRFLANEIDGEEGDPEKYRKIKIPDNMFIWATMNSADQGVFPIDTAFKRRWEFEYLGINKNEDKIKGRLVIGSDDSQEIEWNKLRKAINEKLAKDYKLNEDKLLGPFFISNKLLQTVSDTDDLLIDPDGFKKAFKNKVIMYLYEDAARQVKHKLFSGCEDTTKYSAVCDSFDKIGMKIFGEKFEEDFYNQ